MSLLVRYQNGPGDKTRRKWLILRQFDFYGFNSRYGHDLCIFLFKKAKCHIKRSKALAHPGEAKLGRSERKKEKGKGGTTMRNTIEETLISTPSFRGLDAFRQEDPAQTPTAPSSWVSPDIKCDQVSEHEQPTLLSLVEAVQQVTDDDREVVATVSHLIRSGRVRFSGHFQDATPPAVFGQESVKCPV